MRKKINNHIIKLENKFAKGKKQNKISLCLYCKTGIVLNSESSDLCKECQEDFGHKYLREL